MFFNEQNMKKIDDVILTKGYIETANVLAELAPLAKIAVFIDGNTDYQTVKIFNKTASIKGLKTVVISFGSKTSLTVDNVCGAFSLAEDVRAVVALSETVFPLAEYFASVRKIICVYNFTSVISTIFPSRVLSIRSRKTVNLFKVDAKRLVITPSEVDEKFIKNALGVILGWLSKYVDYKIASSVENRRLNADLSVYDFITEIPLAKESGKSFFTAVYRAYFVGVKTLFGGESENASSINTTCLLLNSDFLTDKNIFLKVTDAIMDIYARLIKNEENFCLPNYTDRARLSALIANLDLKSCLFELKRQAELFFNSSKIDSSFLEYEVSGVLKLYNDVKKIYEMAYGKIPRINAKIMQAVILSGDTPLGINGMSLAREKGVTKI